MAPRPDHAAHGETHSPSNGLNVWTKDTKTKTSKCTTCGEKVNVWSWRSSLCTRSICSVCCDDDPSGVDFSKQGAKDHVENGCWCKRFTTGINPRIAKLLRGIPPPKMDGERAKDHVAKKKAQETSKKKNAAAAGKGSSKKLGRRNNRVVEDEDEEVSPRTQPKRMVADSAFLKVATTAASRRSASGNISALEDPFNLPNPAERRESSKEKDKRSSTAAQLLQDDTDPSSSRKTKKVKKSSSSLLEGGHTIIVGAGVVGLFIAYELATRCVNEGIHNTVTIVEILENHCELASGQCAGFLHYIGMPETVNWISMLSDAQKTWQGLIDRGKAPEFGLLETTYAAESDPDADDESVPMPSWFKPKDIYYVSEAKKVMGRIEPRILADWLRSECDKLGVQFLFGQYLNDVRPSWDGRGYEVEIGKVNGDTGGVMAATHVVLAAGPFTTSIVSNLFNDGKKLGQSNTHSQYLWMDVPLEDASEELEAGIAVATTGDWSAGTLTMVVRPGSDKIEVSAAARETFRSHIDSDAAKTSQRVDWEPLHSLGKQFLRRDNGLQGRDGNSATVSVAKGKHPYVRLLNVPDAKSGELVEKPNIWLSYGFGRYGTTLAPRAARVVVDKMMEGK